MWCCFRNMNHDEADDQEPSSTLSISTDSDVEDATRNETETQRTTNDDEPMKYGDAVHGDGLSRDQWVCEAGETAWWHAWQEPAWSHGN